MCIAKESDYVTSTSGKRFRLLKKLGEGGEGIVYTIEGRPDLLAKVYKKNKRKDENDYKHLEEKILAFEKHYKKFNERFPNVCWVHYAIYYNNKFQGYICRFARGVTLTQWLNDRIDRGNFDDKDIKKLAIKIAILLQDLHNWNKSHPILVGDLQPQNILISSNLDVSIIDSDSFQVGDTLCTVQCPMFVSPERLIDELHHRPSKKRTPDEENYVMAYLFFLMMMYGTVHPYFHFNHPPTPAERIIKGYFPYVQDNGRNVNEAYFERWKEFPPKVREGFKIAFYDSHPNRNPNGRKRRFTPEQWREAFGDPTYRPPKPSGEPLIWKPPQKPPIQKPPVREPDKPIIRTKPKRKYRSYEPWNSMLIIIGIVIFIILVVILAFLH